MLETTRQTRPTHGVTNKQDNSLICINRLVNERLEYLLRNKYVYPDKVVYVLDTYRRVLVHFLSSNSKYSNTYQYCTTHGTLVRMLPKLLHEHLDEVLTVLLRNNVIHKTLQPTCINSIRQFSGFVLSSQEVVIESIRLFIAIQKSYKIDYDGVLHYHKTRCDTQKEQLRVPTGEIRCTKYKHKHKSCLVIVQNSVTLTT